MTVRVVVADDQPLVRAGIVMMIDAQPDLEVLADVGDGETALANVRELAPDVLLIDVRMPVLDGVETTRRLTADRTLAEATRVLVLTTFDDDDAVYGALRAGASGFMLKHAAPRDLIAALRAVARGESWIDPRVAGRVIAALAETTTRGEPSPRLLERLTPREREVLTLMAHGLTNAEITARLVLSEATVKTHVSRILLKTGSHERSQAVVLAYRSGLVVVGSRPTSR